MTFMQKLTRLLNGMRNCLNSRPATGLRYSPRHSTRQPSTCSRNLARQHLRSFLRDDGPTLDQICGRKAETRFHLDRGMSSIEEVAEAIETVKACGNDNILLFHCISGYPAPTEASQLNNLKVLEKEFGVLVGLSDHTQSNAAAIMSIAVLCGVAIEKHFKLDDEDWPRFEFLASARGTGWAGGSL